MAALVGSQEEVPERCSGRQGLHHTPGGQKFRWFARSMSLRAKKSLRCSGVPVVFVGWKYMAFNDSHAVFFFAPTVYPWWSVFPEL